MKAVDRAAVRWFGKAPTPEQRKEIENRGLALYFNETDAPALRYARCAVFWASGEHFRAMVDLLEDNLSTALDEGLLVYVVVSDMSSHVKHAYDVIEKLAPNHSKRELPIALKTDVVSIHEIANSALLHNPGPLASASVAVHNAGGLDPQDLRLLQRAFHDFSEVRLTPISAGFSGAVTFFVESVRVSPVHAEPKPYFVKIGDSEDLVDELSRYRQYAEHFITWTLRPNFVPERSFQGTKRGLLVGTFVEGAESLAECARRGDGVRHITALFEVTMAGLRKHLERKESSVVDALCAYDKHQRIPIEKVAAAQSFGGSVLQPKYLWRDLLSAPRHAWYECVMHGDMHGENARVRQGESILIDFAHTGRGPACADPACLEVSLAFEPDGGLTDREQWRASVEELYHPAIIDKMLSGEAFAQSCWIYGCVGEIRRIAARAVITREEYKLALAVFLLRHASYPANPQNAEDDEFRRTYAYWLANRLVASASSQAHAAQVVAEAK